MQGQHYVWIFYLFHRTKPLEVDLVFLTVSFSRRPDINVQRLLLTADQFELLFPFLRKGIFAVSELAKSN
jgi:hypothetical protein